MAEAVRAVVALGELPLPVPARERHGVPHDPMACREHVVHIRPVRDEDRSAGLGLRQPEVDIRVSTGLQERSSVRTTCGSRGALSKLSVCFCLCRDAGQRKCDKGVDRLILAIVRQVPDCAGRLLDAPRRLRNRYHGRPSLSRLLLWQVQEGV